MKTSLFSILICVSCFVFGQDEKQKKEQTIRKNAFYLELGGNALYYSINYDRIFSISKIVHLSLRVGFFTSPELSSGNSEYVVPLEANILFGKRNNFFELGVGQSIIRENGYHADRFDSYSTLRLGYRHISETGLMVRAGIVPILNEYDKMIWVGLGVGYAF